ncbi:MAG: hypothetical protein GC191_00845 [Azospirillum sp.]|nr:hypothetical protein [Azospirillum sp.]
MTGAAKAPKLTAQHAPGTHPPEPHAPPRRQEPTPAPHPGLLWQRGAPGLGGGPVDWKAIERAQSSAGNAAVRTALALPREIGKSPQSAPPGSVSAGPVNAGPVSAGTGKAAAVQPLTGGGQPAGAAAAAMRPAGPAVSPAGAPAAKTAAAQAGVTVTATPAAPGDAGGPATAPRPRAGTGAAGGTGAPAAGAAATGVGTLKARMQQAAADLPHPAKPAAIQPPLVVRAATPPAKAVAGAHKAAGPAPVPATALPEPASPIPAAMTRIAEAAGHPLDPSVLPPPPPLAAYPNHHTPDYTKTAITAEQQRKLLLAEAKIEAKGVGKEAPESDREQIAALRASFDQPPKPSDNLPPAPPVPVPAPVRIEDKPLPALPEVAIPPEVVASLTEYVAKSLDDESRALARATCAAVVPGGLTVVQIFPELAEKFAPDLKPALQAALGPLPALLGAAGQPVDAALRQRGGEAAAVKQDGASARDQAAATARTEARDGARQKAGAAAAAAQAVAKSAAEKAKGAKTHQPPDLKGRVAAAMAEIKGKVGDAIAGYRELLARRLGALDEAQEKQAGAYRRAALADRFDLEDKNDTHQPKERQVLLGQVEAWARDAIKALETDVGGSKTAASEAVQGGAGRPREKSLVGGVEAAATAAVTELKTWAGAAGADREAWWQDVSTTLDGWAKSAAGAANGWAEVEARMARRFLIEDCATVDQFRQATAAMSESEIEAYVRTLDARTRMVVDGLRKAGSGPPPVLAGFFQDLRSAIAATKAGEFKPRMRSFLVEKATALGAGATVPDQRALSEITAAAAALDPGFNPADIVGQLKNGLGKGSDGKELVFRNLHGLDALGLALVRTAFAAATGGKHLDDEVRKQFEIKGGEKPEKLEPEQQRAAALLAGDSATADAAAVKAAIGTFTNDKKTIKEVLRALDAEGIVKLRAQFKARYNQTLDQFLAQNLDGSDRGEVKALLAGDRPLADAFAIDLAARGGWVSSRDGVANVYEQIRTEVVAEGTRGQWTSSQVEAEIARRKAQVRDAFNSQFANESDYKTYGKGDKALDGALGYGFTKAETDFNKALADNDPAAADAARLQIERNSTFADDDVLNAVYRSQAERALAAKRLDEGPEFDAAINHLVQDEIEQAAKAGKPLTGEHILDRRAQLQHDKEVKLSKDAAADAKKNMADLSAISIRKYHTSLKYIVNHDMSDADQEEAHKRITQGGALGTDHIDDAYERIRYSLGGSGQKKEQLRAALNSLTKQERDQVNERWAREHDGHTLQQDVADKTSGRDAADLAYIAEFGASITVDQQVKEREAKVKRDEKELGWFSGAEAAAEVERAKVQVKALQDVRSDLRNPDLSEDQRAKAMAVYDAQSQFTDAAIQSGRDAVDRLAEKATEVFTKAVTVLVMIAGTLAAVFTGGASLAAAIAIAGSLIGTLGSMGIKRAVRGKAYGRDEFTTDAVIGAVDLAVTLLTLPTGGAAKEVAEFGKQLTIRQGMGRVKDLLKANLKQLAEARLKELGALGRQALTRAIEREGQRLTGRQIAAAAAKRVGHEVVDAGHAFATNFLQGIPTTLAGNLLNHDSWRGGDPFATILSDTLASSFKGAQHGMLFHYGNRAFTGALTTARAIKPPPARKRLDEYRHWADQHPIKPGQSAAEHKREFLRAGEAAATERLAEQDKARKASKEARRELLADLPARERGALKDVPILVVSAEDFHALNGGKPGDSLIISHNGRSAVILRDGAPASVLREHGPQLRDRQKAAARRGAIAQALPSHLRNRITIEPLPESAGNAVHVVPDRLPDGTVRGLKLQAGPLATAADIAGHAGVIEAQRKYMGLLGKARLARDYVHLQLNPEIVTPLKRGQYEAAQELEKLPRLIEQSMAELAAAGNDPRARAAAEEKLAGLRRQYEDNRERFTKGAMAEEKGYVAMENTKPPGETPEAAAETEKAAKKKKAAKRKVKEPPKSEPSDAAAEQPARVDEAAAAEKRKKLTGVGEEITRLKEQQEKVAAEIRRLPGVIRSLKAVRPDLRGKSVRAVIEAMSRSIEFAEQRGMLVEALKQGWDFYSTRNKKFSAFLEELQRDRPQHDLSEALRREEEGDIKTVAQLDEHEKLLETAQKLAEALPARIDALIQEYAQLGGFGVPADSKLPRRVADQDYKPKVLDKLRSDGTERTEAEQLAHVNGFRAEQILANHVVNLEGVKVMKWGDEIGRNGSDIISVDESAANEGEVILWDSKFHSKKTTPFASETFTETDRFDDAIREAIEAIGKNEHEPKLSPAARAKALANLELAATRKLTMITTHTIGDTIVAQVKIVVENGVVVRTELIGHAPKKPL